MMTKDIAMAVLDAQKTLRQANKAYSDSVTAQVTAEAALNDAVTNLRTAIKEDGITDDFAYTINATQLAIVRIQHALANVIKVDVRT